MAKEIRERGIGKGEQADDRGRNWHRLIYSLPRS